MFVFSNAKAGMKDVDKEKVNRVIYEMSKNSSYFKQAQLQDKKVDSKVNPKTSKDRLNFFANFPLFPSQIETPSCRLLWSIGPLLRPLVFLSTSFISRIGYNSR